MINSVGLQNPGIDAVISEELPKLRRCFHKKIIANISGSSAAEYAYCAERISAVEEVGIIEVNISCPNIHDGGMIFGTDPHAAAEVTAAVKRVSGNKPVYMKLSPNVTDIAEIAKACCNAGADGLCLINTLMGMRIDLKTKKPTLARKIGGVSGRAVFPVALAMIYKVYEAASVPIIGMGGVSCANDVLEMMAAGATAVQVGAANLVNPFACRDIIEGLPDAMERCGVTVLSEMIGMAHGCRGDRPRSPVV